VRQIHIKIISLSLCLLLGLTSCLPQSSGTLLSIYEISKAIKGRDFNKMNKYIDVDSILGDCVDVTFGEMKSELGLFGELVDVASLAKPRLVSLSKSQLRSMVEKGRLNKFALQKDLLLSSILGAKVFSLFNKTKSTKRLKIIKRKATDRGEILMLKLRLSSTGDWIPLNLESVRHGKIYKITKITNLNEIKGDILKEVLSSFTN